MIELRRDGRRLKVVDGGTPPARSLRMLFAGICGTDIQILRGGRDDPAEVVGHEGVAWDELDQRHVCFNPVATDDQDRILGHSVPGVLRSHVAVERDLSRPWPQLVSLDDRLARPVGVLVEPMGACLYSWDIIEAVIGTPKHLVVWGAGTLGLLCAAECVSRGVDVTLVHPHRDRLAWARGWVADDRIRFAQEFAQCEAADVAVLAVPRAAMPVVIDQAVKALREAGLLILVGSADAAHAVLPGVDLRRVRRASVSGGHGKYVGVIAATGRSLFVAGHRGTSLAQLHRSQLRLLERPELYSALVTHLVRPEEADAVVAYRTGGSGADSAGRQIIKIVVDFR